MSLRYPGGFLTLSYNPVTAPAAYTGVWTLRQQLQAVGASRWPGIVPPGSATFTGSGTWVAPAGVTSVNAVCIGPSNTWAAGAVAGRGGGGLGWKNNIPVTPGASYTVVVGLFSSGDSYFIDPSIVRGNRANGENGGTFIGDGGGNGGNGGAIGTGSNGGGGGGAGGYLGNGGNGGAAGANSGSAAAAGSGGGGGGAGSTSGAFGGGGGGVGLYGAAATGAGGTYNAASDWALGGGRGGSYGNNGAASNTGGAQQQASFGGGTAGTVASVSGGAVTNAAVRLVWGSGRAFPSTNVDF